MANIDDIGAIGYAIQQYDYMDIASTISTYRDAHGERAHIVLYFKKLDDETQIIAEAITDGKRGKLRIISAYKSTKKDSD